MTVLTVLTWPHKGLRQVAEAVADVKDGEVVQLVQDLKDTLKAYRAQGIAATQVGNTSRVVVVKDGPITRVLINPTILTRDGETTSFEGCLSFPGVRTRLKRAEHVTVSYLDEDGHAHQWISEGLEAVAIQHEIDHLDGKVMLDYMSKLEKNIALRRLKKITKRLGAYS